MRSNHQQRLAGTATVAVAGQRACSLRSSSAAATNYYTRLTSDAVSAYYDGLKSDIAPCPKSAKSRLTHPWRFAVIPSPAFTVAALSSALHNHVPTAHKVFELITVVEPM
jgi:hypothetical protein